MGRRARYGRAEETLAKVLKGRRDQMIIATKIWTSSPSDGREQANHAPRLFGRVEIYQVHNLVNWPAQLRLLEQLKGEGKVDAIGATHYDPSGFDDLCDLMRSGRLDMVQGSVQPTPPRGGDSRPTARPAERSRLLAFKPGRRPSSSGLRATRASAPC